SLLKCFDYFLTLSLEIKYVWPSKWTLVKILYLVMRYIPFFSLTMVILIDKACTRLMQIYSCKFGLFLSCRLITFSSPDAILTLRIWAIYLRTRLMGVLLFVIYIGMVISVFVNVAFLIGSIKFAGLPIANAPTCFIVAASRKLVFFWFVLAAYDTSILPSLIGSGLNIKSVTYGGKSRLVNLIFKDGRD
ncbi:hypothetical protein AMATHDRAFT_148601, partial [Amanita thiersii Skay4041]